MKRIDPQTSMEIHRILEVCKGSGRDPVAALDAAGLLRHQASMRSDMSAFLDVLGAAVRATPVQLLKHSDVPRTPLDLKRYIIDLIDTISKEMETANEQATK